MIRHARPRDREIVLAIWAAAAEAAYPNFTPSFFATERKRIRDEFLPRSTTWLWIHDHAVAGFISHQGPHVGGLFVAPEHQGQGGGRALIEHVRQQHGMLETAVFAFNAGARTFYEKLGFVVFGCTDHPQTLARILKLRQSE
ncbi:MAG: GNAT family N-acetyltransferase [Pseudomonadota bacterium]